MAEQDEPDEDSAGFEWTEEIVHTTRRKQVKLQVAREAGLVQQLLIEQVTTVAGKEMLERVLRLDRAAASRFIDVIHALKYIPVDEGKDTVRLDDETLRHVVSDSNAMRRLYSRNPDRFRELIRNDASAEDLVALAHRKNVVQRFRQLLNDTEAFEEARAECDGKREAVWQRFLEQNPWILGISLAGQLLTSWDDWRLEQVVAGFSVAGPGKRTDALMRTSGRIRSLVFAEIKHHETELLGKDDGRGQRDAREGS